MARTTVATGNLQHPGEPASHEEPHCQARGVVEDSGRLNVTFICILSFDSDLPLSPNIATCGNLPGESDWRATGGRKQVPLTPVKTGGPESASGDPCTMTWSWERCRTESAR
jgi:hypothetical protein